MKYLRTFACVAEVARSESIRRAAEWLSVSPPALTRQIQDMEQGSGTVTFKRLLQGTRLNAVGELPARHIRDQLANLDQVRSQVAGLSGVWRSHVAFALS